MLQRFFSTSAITALAATAILSAASAHAQPAADYPARPVMLIVPYSAGGGADVIARAISKTLSAFLKQPVVVENKPGAAGQIAAAAVAKAPADGYTLLLSTDNMYSINPVLFGKTSQDALAGLEPVANLVGAPVVVAVSASAKSQNIQEMIAQAKAAGKTLSYASPGIGTPHQLAAELIANSAGTKFTHIPYKGTAAAMTDLVGGQVDMLFGMPASVQPLAAGGKVRIMAVTSPGRFDLLPGVPTVAETLKGVSISTVDMGLMVPKGTPAEIVRKLNEGVQRSLADRDVKATIVANGMVSLGGSAADYASKMKEARVERERIISITGVKAEQ